jgi:uncharacterized membrane protein
MRRIPGGSMKRAKPGIPDHVTETLETIAELHSAAEGALTPHQRSVEAVAAYLGRPRATYAIGILVITWVTCNLALLATHRPALDPPPFPWLQTVSTVMALIVTTVVLTTQNRRRKLAEERMQLDLQVNLLAERKVAKLIALVEELRRDMPNVENREDLLAEAMTEALDPHAVVTALRETLQARDEQSLNEGGSPTDEASTGEAGSEPPPPRARQ